MGSVPARSTQSYTSSATTRRPPDFEHMLAQLQFRELKARSGKHCYHNSWTRGPKSGSCCFVVAETIVLKVFIVLVTSRKHPPN